MVVESKINKHTDFQTISKEKKEKVFSTTNEPNLYFRSCNGYLSFSRSSRLTGTKLDDGGSPTWWQRRRGEELSING